MTSRVLLILEEGPSSQSEILPEKGGYSSNISAIRFAYFLEAFSGLCENGVLNRHASGISLLGQRQCVALDAERIHFVRARIHDDRYLRDDRPDGDQIARDLVCPGVRRHRSPHPFIERLIGTIRRECLDQLLFWTATDLQLKLTTFKEYYNGYRTHSGLEGRTPIESSESTGINIKSYRW